MAKSTKKPEAKDQPASKKASAPGKTTKSKATAEAGAETGAAKASESKAKKAAKPGKVSGKRAPLAPKTFYAPWGTFSSKWKVIDAAGLTLGRLSTQVAHVLMGKHLPQYTRHAATGDFVIVINAKKIVVTGKKLTDKLYQWHTGYPGGIKTFTVQEMLDRHPERVVERSIFGMLPKGHVGRKWQQRLHVYAGADHPHKAQLPETMTLPKSGSEHKNA